MKSQHMSAVLWTGELVWLIKAC